MKTPHSLILLLLVALSMSLCLAFARAPANEPAAALPDGDYYIVSKLSLKPMTVTVGKSGEVSVAQYDWSAQRDSGQVWTLKHEGDGYTLRSKQHGLYLVIPDASQETGAAAEAGRDETAQDQRWELLPFLDTYNIVAKHSGQALGVNGAFPDEGVDYLQWEPPVAADNEQFWFLPAERGYPSRHRLLADPLAASRYDNQSLRYHLLPQVDAKADGRRALRRSLMQQHPSGIHVAAGETLQFDVTGLLPERAALVLAVGQPYEFEEDAKGAEQRQWLAHPGRNQITSPHAGMLYFRYVDVGFGSVAVPPVDVQIVAGGTAAPFYVAGQTSLAQWRRMLDSSRSPYVQMVGPRVMMTVRRDLFDRSRQDDPAIALAYLARMIRYHDQVSGLDCGSDLDQPSPLRIHYLQDDRPQEAPSEVFMYATDGFIGMPDDSALVLLDNPASHDAWALWHEAGHLYQQSDWTWNTLLEVTVNLYSLHAQERFGLPSRLDEVDPESGKNYRDWARTYLAADSRNFNDDSSFPEDSSGWARLVMYEQLRKGLGEDFFPALHKYYRLHPLNRQQRTDEQVMIQQFVYRSSLVAKVDLSDFFDAWGLPADDDTARAIQALNLPPAEDLTQAF